MNRLALVLASWVLLPAVAMSDTALRPDSSAAAAAAASVAPADKGRAVFDAQHCVRCHAIGGKGNKLRPLDSIGLKLDAAALRTAITAGDTIKPRLNARALAAKQKFATLPAADLDALVGWLLQQKAPPKAK